VFFSDPARGLVISFTSYSPRADWWRNNVLFYEYGVNDIVRLSKMRNYPFKPNVYETPSEKIYFYIDIFRFSLNIIVIIFILAKKVSFD
jgi:hypothetical protein